MKNYKVSILLSLTGAIFLGCASKPQEITTQYVSPIKYQNYDCSQVSSEVQMVSSKVSDLYYSLDKKATNDQVQMGASLLFWPMLFTLEGGDGLEAKEYSRLKGELEALEHTSIQKKCHINFDGVRPENIAKRIEEEKAKNQNNNNIKTIMN